MRNKLLAACLLFSSQAFAQYTVNPYTLLEKLTGIYARVKTDHKWCNGWKYVEHQQSMQELFGVDILNTDGQVYAQIVFHISMITATCDGNTPAPTPAPTPMPFAPMPTMPVYTVPSTAPAAGPDSHDMAMCHYKWTDCRLPCNPISFGHDNKDQSIWAATAKRETCNNACEVEYNKCLRGR